MGTLISIADGNLTGSTTFAAAEAGALATVLTRFSINSFTVGSSTSASFTVTSGKVIDAVLLWVRQGTAGVAGTFKVDLQKGGVSQGSVTVNRVDLPDPANAFPQPVLFKLGTTATGDGAANWTIVTTTTGAGGTVNYYAATASGPNFTRALRTTTTQAPAAADDLYIVGELTGAGTHNSRTVTMDSTAATAYGNGALNSTTVAGGGIHISNWGTLSYGTTAGTNYILRVAGDVMVYQFGTLIMGSSQGYNAKGIDGTAGGQFTGAGPGTITLSTTLTNDVIVLVYFHGRSATQTISSVTSPNLTWTKRSNWVPPTATDYDYEIWWAPAASVLTSEVITITVSAAIDDAAYHVFGVNGCSNISAPWDTHASLATARNVGSASVTVSGVSTNSAASMTIGLIGSRQNLTGTTIPAGTTRIRADQLNTGGSQFAFAGSFYQNNSAALSSASYVSTSSGFFGMAIDALA